MTKRVGAGSRTQKTKVSVGWMDLDGSTPPGWQMIREDKR